jgi:hypothetical protein
MCAPELVVEDDVLDIEVLGMGDQPVGEHPPLAPVLLGHRAKEMSMARPS